MLGAEGHRSLPWEASAAVLSELVAQVARWLRDAGLRDLYPWVADDSPLEHAVPPLFRAVELLTGRGLDELCRGLGVETEGQVLHALGLTGSASDPAESPQCQILRDLSPGLAPDLGALLRDMVARWSSAGDERSARWHEGRVIALDAAAAAVSPEGAGQLAAQRIRGAMGLDGRPVDDVPATLERLGTHTEHTDVRGGHDRMIAAAATTTTTGARGAPLVATLQTARTDTSWGGRFEQARGLGHVLLDPLRAGALGAASGPFSQSSRRRRAGAFAAELLLPEQALAEASGHRLDGAAAAEEFKGLLGRFGVGATTAAHQLWNHGWLSSEDVRDGLIEAFAGALG